MIFCILIYFVTFIDIWSFGSAFVCYITSNISYYYIAVWNQSQYFVQQGLVIWRQDLKKIFYFIYPQNISKKRIIIVSIFWLCS